MRHAHRRNLLNFTGAQLGDAHVHAGGRDMHQVDVTNNNGLPPEQLLQVGKEIAGALGRMTTAIAVQSFVLTLVLVLMIGLLFTLAGPRLIAGGG